MTLLRVPCLAPLLVCLIAGCGLADYEKRLDAQRARVRVFDEENKYLGDMLEPPPVQKTKEGDRSIPFPIFLRLPRGIAPSCPDKNGAFLIYDQVVFRYPGSEGTNVFLACALAGTQKNIEKGEWPPEEFQTSFRQAVGWIVRKRAPEKIERRVRPATTYSGEKLPDLEFDYFVMDDDPAVNNATSIAVYIHQRASRLIAVAFQVPLGSKTDPAVQQGIDLCVKTLDISDDAFRKRSAFAATRRLD